MKGREGLRWLMIAIVGMLLFYLGKINYHQRNPAEFVLAVLIGVAIVILAFYFLPHKQGRGR